MTSSTKALAAACVYMVSFWWLNVHLGFISLDNPAHSIMQRDASAATILPLLTAVLIFGSWKITQVGVLSIEYLTRVDACTSVPRSAHMVDFFSCVITGKKLLFILVLSIILASLYLIGSGAMFTQSPLEHRWALLMQAYPLWFMLVFTVTAIITLHTKLRVILNHSIHLSLFEAEKLYPVSDFLFTVLLVLCISLGVYSLNAIFIDLPWIDAVIMTLVLIFIMILLVAPLNLINTSLSRQKSDTLTELNTLISDNVNHEFSSSTADERNRRLVDDTQRLQYVSDLLLIRKEIQSISSVPITQPTIIKFTLIMFIPLLSWIGAGLVSQALKIVI